MTLSLLDEQTLRRDASNRLVVVVIVVVHGSPRPIPVIVIITCVSRGRPGDALQARYDSVWRTHPPANTRLTTMVSRTCHKGKGVLLIRVHDARDHPRNTPLFHRET